MTGARLFSTSCIRTSRSTASEICVAQGLKKTENNCCQTIELSLSMRANAPSDGAGANRFCSKMHKKWTDKQLTSEERMKFNKWTVGLAAAGIVTLPSLVKAADPVEMVKTAAADTTLSGYVD